MIPLKLTIKGMYSYLTEQTIDFTDLTRNHLFGIFGPVGSGKSTILEAISYALYGETERLNARDGRNYNMMNLKSNDLLIDFIFRAGKNNDETYRFTVKGTRDKKNYANVRTLDRSAYRKEGDTWLPLEISTAEEIIGLSYENFRRTIIIPQGQFQEFLQLTDADRTRMMKEIFNLDRYDLSAKTEIVERKTSFELEGINGQLIQIGELDQKDIGSASEKLSETVKRRSAFDTQLSKHEKTEKKMQDSKSLFDRLASAKEAATQLERESDHYDKREQLVDRYETCLKNFPDLLKQRNELMIAVGSSQKRVEDKRNALAKTAEAIRNDEQLFIHLKDKYERRSEIESRWKELQLIENVGEIDRQLVIIERSRAKMEKSIETKKEVHKRNQANLKVKEAELKKTKKDMPDEKILLEIKRWHDKYTSIGEDISRQKDVIKEQHKTFKELEDQKKELTADPVVISYCTPAERKFPPDQLLQVVKKVIKNCQSEAAKIQQEIDALTRTEVLESFAGELKDNEPCPLCGSKHHPDIYAGRGVKTQIDHLSRDKRKKGKDVEKLQNTTQELVRLASNADNAVRIRDKAEKELDTKQKALAAHDEKFVWKNFSRDDIGKIDDELKRAESIKDNISDIEEEIESLRNGNESLSEELTSLQEEVSGLKQKSSELTGTRKTMISQIKNLEVTDYSEWTPQQFKKEIQRLKNEFEDVKRQYDELTGSIQKNKELNSKTEGEIAVEEKNLTATKQSLDSIEKQIDERLAITGFDRLSTVEIILKEKVDVKKERDAIRAFQEKLASATDQVSKLIQETSGQTYDAERHAELKDEIARVKLTMQQLSQEIGKLESDIAEMKANIEAKQKLEEKRTQLTAKAENIAILKRLFRGGKFVNYASRVYLQNLCGIANNRFAQLTGQKLKLELREDNSFEVRDFLNDGNLRSVKTLSGGQTFQASFSLALALADNMQQFANTDENFFFMDEGFGTLDKESLRIVFEALKILRTENRIVGVISHVEELQQEIDNYVQVSLDPERGSVISNV